MSAGGGVLGRAGDRPVCEPAVVLEVAIGEHSEKSKFRICPNRLRRNAILIKRNLYMLSSSINSHGVPDRSGGAGRPTP